MKALIFYFVFSHFMSFLCSILEAVILCCSQAYIALLRKRKSHAGAILHDMKMRIDRPLAAILTLNTASHTFGAAGVGAKVVELFGNPWLSVASVVITLTMLYWTEMVPKTVGALYWKRLSIPSAYVIKAMIILTYPFVVSFEWLARVISRGKKRESITEEEIRVLMEEGAKAGAIEAIEQSMVERIFRLGDRRVGVLMTPRREIQWLDIRDTPEKWMEEIQQVPHHLFPVCDGELDHVLGIVRTKDVLFEAMKKKPLEIRKLLLPPLYVHENALIFHLFEELKKSPLDSALVTDEYGNIQGWISLYTVLDSILGELSSSPILPRQPAIRGKNGAWILDGKLPIDEFKELFHIESLPKEEKNIYRTLAGFCLFQLGSIPHVGEEFVWDQYRFKIIKMDGRRVATIKVSLR